jgi:hypothetical protein
MSPTDALTIGNGTLRPDIEPETVFLTVRDEEGTYTIPYIQSARDLPVSADFQSLSASRIRLSLRHPAAAGADAQVRVISREQPAASFEGLAPGEYELEATGMDGQGKERCQAVFRRIGIGTVAAALGSSIVEGYFGHSFWRDRLDLTSGDFLPENVSRDGRNFPQYSPTTGAHLPTVNCMQSWMTRLNDLLSESLAHPVFIANEGWGGYKTDDYIRLMRESAKWQERMRLLRPTLWLLHIGINDERASCDADVFGRNLAEIVRMLIEDYGARPEGILLARLCYDYWPNALMCMEEYCERIDALTERLGLPRGPDFFDAFSRDRERWYGADPVHPNVEGTERMAEMWHRAIVQALGVGGGGL